MENSKLSPDEIEAVIKKLGGDEGVRQFLSGETIVVSKKQTEVFKMSEENLKLKDDKQPEEVNTPKDESQTHPLSDSKQSDKGRKHTPPEKTASQWEEFKRGLDWDIARKFGKYA